MWADSLKLEEVEATLSAADYLSAVRWAAPLLNQTESILDRLRIGITDKAAYQRKPLQPSEMSFLFEIRFARSLALAGLAAQYEHHTGVGNTTVDFRVDLGPPWLVELVSLHESAAFKRAAWQSGSNYGYALRTNAEDRTQSEEGETIKAQERIGEKVFERKKGPIKFPEPAGSIHMLMVDARGYMGDGRSQKADWHQIAYGRHGLEDHLVKCWINDKTGKPEPIRGLFEPNCPLTASPTMRERVHFIGFVCERTFATGEIWEQSFYCCNPALVETEQKALSVMSSWPLQRTM